MRNAQIQIDHPAHPIIHSTVSYLNGVKRKKTQSNLIVRLQHMSRVEMNRVSSWHLKNMFQTVQSNSSADKLQNLFCK